MMMLVLLKTWIVGFPWLLSRVHPLGCPQCLVVVELASVVVTVVLPLLHVVVELASMVVTEVRGLWTSVEPFGVVICLCGT